MAVQPELADQLADHPAADPVVASQVHALGDGQLTGINGGLPGRQVVIVLEIGIVGLADSGNTERHQVAFGVGGIALKIPVQAAFALCHRKAVVRLGEMVHADVFITGVQQAIDGVVQDGQLLLRTGQGVALNPGLRIKTVRQVGIAEHGEPVRRHFNHRFQCLGKAFRGLVRQAVDQVQVDGPEADAPRLVEHGFGHVPRLDTVHGFLNLRVDVLNAETDPVEAQVPQGWQGILIHFPGINFHAVIPLLTGLQVEQLPVSRHQVLHHIFWQERGGTAAPVQLGYRPVGPEQF